jgi:cyanamide hydratase
MTRHEDIKAYGFTALPRPMTTLLAARKDPQPPTPLTTDDIPLPSSPLVTAVLEHAKRELPTETFNHSMRVFYYGTTPASTPIPPI